MGAQRMWVGDLWIQETVSIIERALQGSPDGEERRRRLVGVADSLRALIRGKGPDIEQVVRVGIERTVRAGTLTEEEGEQLLARP